MRTSTPSKPLSADVTSAAPSDRRDNPDSSNLETAGSVSSACSEKVPMNLKRAEIGSPPSLVELATQEAELDLTLSRTGERRAWAECPMEPVTSLCDDPTPHEALLVATAASNRHQMSSDSGGEDSAKENKENVTSLDDKSKNLRKKGV